MEYVSRFDAERALTVCRSQSSTGKRKPKKSGKDQEAHLAEFIFDLNLDSAVAIEGSICRRALIADAVVALIKFFLYQRGQTPDMFDSMASSVAADAKKAGCATMPSNLVTLRRRQQDKKTKAFVESFAELFANLRNLFHNDDGEVCEGKPSSWIRRVALVIGSTPITPKEVHCIELVPFCAKKCHRSLDTFSARPGPHIQSMFRSLVSSSRDIDFPRCPSRTNVTIMIEASATFNMIWFVPKSYSPLTGCSAKRGRRFNYRLSSAESPATTLSANIEDKLRRQPFAVYESPAAKATTSAFPIIQTPTIETVEEDSDTPSSVRRSLPPDAFVWFQMPAMVRGLNLRS